MPCEKHSYSIWHIVGAQKCLVSPSFEFMILICPGCKTALAVNESSLSLSFPLLQAWWPAYGRCLIQIWLLIAFAEKGRMLRPAHSKNSGSYRCQRAWVDLSPALSREQWFNNCDGMVLLFGMIARRSKGSGHCYDSKTSAVTKKPWVCKVRLGSRWGQFSHKRKCYLLPDFPPYVQGLF